ncbi:hypothetical protein [Allorhodopirellula heiligendammensis]|uniref:Uncharacterized protein n=1 Tax=Allorhodopirellula heiligendammensis TaxID=2714739 RepID=A0A5C6BWY6_9BACT|nr:hypothetical protein [Allorhodopirellula heiligendammensis]TWU16783.1 hypothetical protein Poly21_39900 [Allorhodopirellula heiligendammensis]
MGHGDHEHDSDSIEFSDIELLAFLDELLAPENSARIEVAIREHPELHQRLVRLRGQNVAGLHTIGAIWRRERLSCPDRELLRRHLLGEIGSEESDYIRFHLNDIGCRVCNANFDDLTQAIAQERDSQHRRHRMFQTSAGHLR